MRLVFILLTTFLALANCKTAVKESNQVVNNANSDTTLSLEYETEAEEEARLLKERMEEEEIIFSELGMYNGKYLIDTESEGVESFLELEYKGEKVFAFKLFFSAPIAGCEADIAGEIFMDRTQHGFYPGEGCFLHFNFRGLWAGKMIIEIEMDNGCVELKGDCYLTATYVREL